MLCGLSPMQKRWYHSSHLSHCTQCTCFPVGLLHFGFAAEQSSSPASAAAFSAALASSFFFFFAFLLSLSSTEIPSHCCLFFNFSAFLSSRAATSSASSASSSGYFLSRLPGVAWSSLQMECTSSKLTSSRSPSTIKSSNCTMVLAARLSTTVSGPAPALLLLLGRSTSCSASLSLVSPSPPSLSSPLVATWLSALASSGAARRVLARSCQAIALSVKHCNASPSGSRTVSFCSETRRLRMVSRRGLRDLRQAGHKNLISLKLPGFSRFPCSRGSGTVPGANFSLQSSQSSLAVGSSLLFASEFLARTSLTPTNSACSACLNAFTISCGSDSWVADKPWNMGCLIPASSPPPLLLFLFSALSPLSNSYLGLSTSSRL